MLEFKSLEILETEHILSLFSWIDSIGRNGLVD